MSLLAYFIVADGWTVSLLIILDKVSLTSCKNAFDFEKGFEDTSPLKRNTLMMWMADVDGTSIFCAFVYQHNM